MPSRILAAVFAILSAFVSFTSLAQTAAVAPTSLSFGNLAVDTTSLAKTATLTNSGTIALNIASISTTGDFAQTNNCPLSLAKKAKCSILVTFTPTLTGARTGSLVFSDNGGTGTQTVVLKGAGVPQVFLSATTLSFGTLVVGVSSTPKAIVLTNNLAVPLNISGVVSASGDYSVQNGCGSQVPGKSSCSIAVTFTPRQ